jgi:hypothetical protein
VVYNGIETTFSLILICIFFGVGSFTETRLMDGKEIVKNVLPLTFRVLDVMSLMFFFFLFKELEAL